jgi:adenylate kinase
MGQAEALDGLLQSRGEQVNLVIRMRVDDERLLARVTKRFEEQGRADDNPETFSRRLERYYEDTAPLVPLYAERGVLVEVDGMGTIEAVAVAIDAALKQSA